MGADWIIVGVLAAVALLLLAAGFHPRLKGWRFRIERVAPRKKRRTKKSPRKQKSLIIKLG